MKTYRQVSHSLSRARALALSLSLSQCARMCVCVCVCVCACVCVGWRLIRLQGNTVENGSVQTVVVRVGDAAPKL
eukprot:COSAG03_NODE_12100_length_561_cov_0.883117_1_plen_75_part_00